MVDPKFGVLVTNPSLSPENEHGHGSSLVAGPTMDQAIIRDLFTNCLKAEAILGAADEAFVAEPRAARDKLAPYKIGKDGQLQEWQEDVGRRRCRYPPPSRLAPLRPVPIGPDPRSTPRPSWRLRPSGPWSPAATCRPAGRSPGV
ncbi:glycosyl hydrolase family 95 catalytic domain-containing protein [Caulobacter segnis]